MNPRLSGIGMTSQRTRLRMVERLRKEGIRDETVLGVMAEIPRHIFVAEALASRAYEDIALPLGYGQTISQPFIVARMAELARNSRDLDKVLEIGAGCGYQTAILARLARQVYALERLAPLLNEARRNLRELRKHNILVIHNVRLKHADGHVGIPEAAPFDAIVIAAAATRVPDVLCEQLAPGGRMVMPLGREQQRLCVIERTARGFSETQLDAVKFVPMLPGVS